MASLSKLISGIDDIAKFAKYNTAITNVETDIFNRDDLGMYYIDYKPKKSEVYK